MTRIGGIDLIRGIAIALVMLRHAFPEPFAGAGVVGVVMFFTLSGYLITGVLLDEHARTGRTDLRAFYLRRARRLVPALVLLVLAVVVVTLVADPLDDRGRLLRTAVVALTWTGDLPFDHGSDATFHLWTLATEEQFYLLWPTLLGLAVSRRRLGLGLTLTAVGCLLGCVATLVWLSPAFDLAYTLPTSWAVSFVVGAAARVYAGALPTPGTLAVPIALALLALLCVIPLRGHPLTYLAGGPAIAVLTALLLLRWRTWVDVGQPALRLVVLLGTVSYGAYLWNYPLTLWLRATLDHGAGPVAAVLTVAAAALSWRWVERPALRRTTRRAVSA